MNRQRKISILGSTGSIGRKAFEIVSSNPNLFSVGALVANSNFKALAQQAISTKAEVVALFDSRFYKPLHQLLRGTETEILSGQKGCEAAAEIEVDVVVSAISGIAGLGTTLAALKKNRNLAIANKETLICAGNHINSFHNVNLIPIDSEHHAISQIYNKKDENIDKITLTASGGPFFHEKPGCITQNSALKHPIWSMGPKNSIDSATLMNKVLEVFETEVLFGIGRDRIKLLIHPQSIIHGMVSCKDGNNIAVLYNPDMGIPISNALSWPKKIPYRSSLDLTEVGLLTFYQPDHSQYPALELLKSDQCLLINAANEVAVSMFLQGKIEFDKIVPLVIETLNVCPSSYPTELAEILEVDKKTRETAMKLASKTVNIA